MEFADKMQRCHDYVEALEEERRKILVFQRELPLCLELVTQAIDACKRELSGTTTDYMHGQSECSEQTSSEGPVLEEFIPIERTPTCSDNDEGNEDEDEEDERELQKSQSKRNRSSSSNKYNLNSSNGDLKKKADWLRSVQLWSQSPDPSPKEDGPRKAVVTEVKRNGGFQPFQKEKSSSNEKRSSTSNNNNNQTVGKSATSTVPASAASSTAQTTAGGNSGGGSNGRKEEKEGQQQRKQRRCWSPELHRRFLRALQQLGGSHAATPKQIRELMKVDGLTNDEVKSHLQKYRLHTRRPSPTIHNNNNPQTPQFVVDGGIWMSPPEYAAVAATTTADTAATNAIYAPVAAPPPSITQLSTSVLQNQQNSQLASEGRGSHSEGGVRSNSPSTSSSPHTTTNSPNFLFLTNEHERSKM